MFQKKKGFTLIELLAVIVILAVIALIATPLIMNVINDAKKNSFKDSAYGIIKAVEMRVATEQINNTDGQNVGYKVDVTGNGIDYNGDRPDSGWASVDVDGVVTLYMIKGDWCAYKNNTTNNQVVISTTVSDCSAMNTIENNETLATLTKDGSEGGTAGQNGSAIYTGLNGDFHIGSEPVIWDGLARYTAEEALEDQRLALLDEHCYGEKSRLEYWQDEYNTCMLENDNNAANCEYELSEVNGILPEYNSCLEGAPVIRLLVASKAIVEDNIVTENYIVFKRNNTIYTIKGGINEVGSSNQPVFDENVRILQSAFDDGECNLHDDEYPYYMTYDCTFTDDYTEYSVMVQEDGNIIATNNFYRTWGDVIHHDA